MAVPVRPGEDTAAEDSAALVARARARPEYRAALVAEANGRLDAAGRAAVLRRIYGELLAERRRRW